MPSTITIAPIAPVLVGQSFTVSGTSTAASVTVTSQDGTGKPVAIQTITPTAQNWSYVHAAVAVAGPLVITVTDGSGATASVTVQINAAPVVSPDRTSVTTVGPAIIDTQGRSFTLMAADASAKGQQIGVNGVRDTRTANAVQLYAMGGVAYHKNTAGNWYNLSAANVWQGPDADPTIVPGVTASKDGTTAADGVTVLITNDLTSWKLTGVGEYRSVRSKRHKHLGRRRQYGKCGKAGEVD